MKKGFDTEIKVGIFVTIGIGLILISVLLLGGTESLFVRKTRFYAHFPTVDGLVNGAKIVMDGLQVGIVDQVDFDLKKRDVLVSFQIARAQADWIRADSSVQIATQGVLGDKYIILSRGSDSQPALPPESVVPHRSGEGLSHFLSKSDQLLNSLQSIAGGVDRLVKTFETDQRAETFFKSMAATSKSMASASEKLNKELDDLHLKTLSKNLNGILEKINNGTGTLGALINDPGLYDDAKALMGGANRNRIVRNLVRQTIKKSEEEKKE